MFEIKDYHLDLWRTFVPLEDGRTMTFFIAVPSTTKDENTVYAYGEEYLAQQGITNVKLSPENCRYAYTEVYKSYSAEELWRNPFRYKISSVEIIPNTEPGYFDRRGTILYLRAKFPEYRFFDFCDLDDKEIREIYKKATGSRF